MVGKFERGGEAAEKVWGTIKGRVRTTGEKSRMGGGTGGKKLGNEWGVSGKIRKIPLHNLCVEDDPTAMENDQGTWVWGKKSWYKARNSKDQKTLDGKVYREKKNLEGGTASRK